MTESETEYLTIKAACELLGVSHNTLRSWGAAEKIVEYRHPVNNYRLFRKDDLLELKERLANPQPKRAAQPKPTNQRKAK